MSPDTIDETVAYRLSRGTQQEVTVDMLVRGTRRNRSRLFAMDSLPGRSLTEISRSSDWCSSATRPRSSSSRTPRAHRPLHRFVSRGHLHFNFLQNRCGPVAETSPKLPEVMAVTHSKRIQGYLQVPDPRQGHAQGANDLYRSLLASGCLLFVPECFLHPPSGTHVVGHSSRRPRSRLGPRRGGRAGRQDRISHLRLLPGQAAEKRLDLVDIVVGELDA